MKILLAPDSFKESLSAEAACIAIEKGIRKVFPEATIKSLPMADGGEGTVRCLVNATRGMIINVRAHDPLMRPLNTFYGILGDGETAVIETAAASGLELLKPVERNPLKTTTYGTGELIRHALDMGCRKIIVGLGGSATNDGGAGMVMALGAEFKDQNGEPISYGGEALKYLASIDPATLDPRLKDTSFLIACDVSNPLYGERGASFVFGKQKGATDDMMKVLDSNLYHFSEAVGKATGKEIGTIPGGGAAGGLGAGFLAFFNAELKPGFSIVSEFAGLEDFIKEADLIVTGEGKTDLQTLSGKVPYGMGILGQKYKVPVILFAGSLEKGSENLYQHGITTMISICPKSMDLEEALSKAAVLLEQSVERTFRLLTIKGI